MPQSRQERPEAQRLAAKLPCTRPRCAGSLVIEYLNGQFIDVRRSNLAPVGFLPPVNHIKGGGCADLSYGPLASYPVLTEDQVEELRRSDRAVDVERRSLEQQQAEQKREQETGAWYSISLGRAAVLQLNERGALPHYDPAVAAARRAGAGRLAALVGPEAAAEGAATGEEEAPGSCSRSGVAPGSAGSGAEQQRQQEQEQEEQQAAGSDQEDASQEQQGRTLRPRARCGNPSCGLTRREAAHQGRKLRLCAACLSERYCSTQCQRQALTAHRAECGRTAAERAAAEV